MTRRFPIGLTIASLICFAILVALGLWQLERLKWKEDILAKREAARTSAPRPLVPALISATGPEALDGIRVEVTCPGLSQAPFEELYALAEGQMVTRLVSPCRLEGAPFDAVLVDRGYVLMTISSRPAVIPGDDYPVHVVGILTSPTASMKNPAGSIAIDRLPTSPGEKKLWMGRDLTGMAAALGVVRPAPYFLVAENSTNPDWQALSPGMPPVIISNNHLSYALTWFGLAGVLVAIYAAMLRKRYKD